MFRNSTNIPDRLVAIAAAFALPSNCPPVACIKIKNKRRGKFGGKWGYFYPEDNTVVIIVPRKITKRHTFKLKYARKQAAISSRAEFLVMILAHELRHAWQHAHWTSPSMKWRLERDRIGKYAREVDAEIWEHHIFLKWQREIVPLLKEVA